MQLMKWVTAAALLVSALASGADEPRDEPRLAINLHVYAQVEIARPASTVWPLIVDTNSWKPDRPMVHRAGPVGQLGEVSAIVSTQHPGQVWFLAENVELVPNQRRTIKLLDLKGNLLGFASWGLMEQGGRTLIDYQIHAESRVAPEQKLTAAQVAEQQRNGYAVNKQRVDDELAELKRRLESGTK